MSNVFDAIAWAIKVSRGEPMPARMLLIVGLAQRVSDREDGFVVWPSNKQLCADTDMSRTSVKKWMRYLEERHLVEVFQSTRDSGATGSNRYRLPIKAVFYHPTKGAMEDDVGGEGSPSDRGRGRNPTMGGSDSATGEGSAARPCSEPPLEQSFEGRESAPDELDLGLPPVEPKECSPAELALLIADEWKTRAAVTPLRGGRLSETNAEKAHALATKYAVEGQNLRDVWREIFERIDGSDFLQGKVLGREGRPPFKLTLSFLLEKRNFDKTLEGRFDGHATGERRRGSTSEATSRVVDRIRSGASGRARGGNQALAISGR